MKIVLNKDVIAINQDRLGKSAVRIDGSLATPEHPVP